MFSSETRSVFYITTRSSFSVLLIALAISSCDNFLDVDVPNSKITDKFVFSDEATANAALAGIYLDLYRDGGFAGGGRLGIVTLAGLSADELKNNAHDDPLYIQYERNDIDPNNMYLLSLWTSMYKTIYEANAMLEGLDSSSGLNSSQKKQLSGEALFIRAFCFFYLVNTFGDVPLVTSTNYTINRGLSRALPSEVYDQIKTDLLSAENLLSMDYVSPGRVRPNSLAASALLSRVYLYTGDWARAEDKASKVIARTDLYSLLDDPNKVFLQGSLEAIWQLKPADNAFNTNEGYIFSKVQGPLFNVLKDEMVLSYEENDCRQNTWITSTASGGKDIYLPFKYKKFDLVTPTDEYSMVIRLAEIYLIRSEARLKQNKLESAILDIDSIRFRAKLPLIHNTDPTIDSDHLFKQIIHERKIELMVEWGHRWFDLKRWGIAVNVLSAIKTGFSAYDSLYPIPQAELFNNKNLEPQNAGY
ncbi:RagB/SusD family nutrient uptake outer membrane protein [Dawidia soli]|uniref:RagB/SusD family nutrient uptake outer membrane protein n=1 Tax=Dawidia soli TaxID=2782352 RepID=A0AAP2DBZ0_9BACT|nr:RagB/SusD family nutrient uptake outer membrane protein [Dawidia soli]MBT1688301.1 RagB/SusD family nutrient uptake outer membrane protein [Dawidia soli]